MLKFKQQYRNNYEITYNEKDKPVRYYPYLRNYIFKCFSTKQEKSAYFLHIIEYKRYKLKIRTSRGKNLPNPYDDYSSNAYKLLKSWKHNSKRKKQYHNC
ncbi:hypothetical protein DKK70_07940 [Gilliamella apicola]|uniref:Uncharacterized protein n=1 Tax=Gilliamella apicola TaxID=1196095 RepID=A0A2V4E3H3_9GAMM|nr:hypothetical protein DKK70_07940 [Gilliamella apicola]